MDTRDLVVEIEERAAPDWAADAVRAGGRIALELIRAPRLPERIRIVGRAHAGALRGAGDSGAVTAHDEHEVVIAYSTLVDEAYIGTANPGTDAIRHTLAFCAGFECTVYAAEQAWMRPAWSGDDEDALHQAASRVACIASEFRMVPADNRSDQQSAAVTFFLERLATLCDEEGGGAIWRGAVGIATRALVREVRFSEVPGRVAVFGERLQEPADVHRLVAFVRGDAPWPFPARTR